MIVMAIKLKNSIQLLGELVVENDDSIVIRDVISFKETLFSQQTSTPYIMNIPHLYFPYSESMEISIDKSDILFYDVADEYTTFYYSNVFYDLIESENKKRDFVVAMYDQVSTKPADRYTDDYVQDTSEDLTDDVLESFLHEDQKPTLH